MEEKVQAAIQQSIFTLMISGQLKACNSICVVRPTSELSAGEKQCLAMCQDRYEEVFKKTFFKQFEDYAKAQENESHKPT